MKKIVFVILVFFTAGVVCSQDSIWRSSNFGPGSHGIWVNRLPSYYYQWWDSHNDENGEAWPFLALAHSEPIISYQTNREFLFPHTAPFTLQYNETTPACRWTITHRDSTMLGWRDAMEKVEVPYPLMVIGLAAQIMPHNMLKMVNWHMPVFDSLLLQTFDESGNARKIMKIPWFPDDTCTINRNSQTISAQISSFGYFYGCEMPQIQDFVDSLDATHCWESYKEYYFDEPVKVQDSCYIGSTQWGSFWNHAQTQFGGGCVTGGVTSVVPLYTMDEGRGMIGDPLEVARTLRQFECPMWDSVQCMFKDFEGNWHYVKRVPRLQMWLLIDTTMLGIGQVESEYGLNVYPNPATTYTRIKANVPIKHILVYDQMGRMMYRDAHTAQEILLNVGHWPKGTYVMKIHLEGSNKQYVQKLVVQ